MVISEYRMEIGIIANLYTQYNDPVDFSARVKFERDSDYYYLRHLRKVILIGPQLWK